MKLPKTFFLLSLIFVSIQSFGQQNENNPVYDNGIYINPTQLLLKEIILSYEHFHKDNFSVEYSLGYKIAKYDENTSYHGDYIFIENSYMLDPNLQALYISVAPTLYFISTPPRKFFLGFEVFNRYYWMNDKLFHNDEQNLDYRRTQRNNVTGLKVIIGTNAQINLSHKHLINVKFYTGLGLRYKIETYKENYNINPEINIGSLTYRDDTFVPSLQLGLKIGIAKKKEIL
ncbi:hypothetical protein [Aureibacter tunicatorum]|uniref:DUF3575 domain-containing protein n=1 Tax=Aureibacter tunicatorum TaxID=866807 RepID=A0AAE3XRK8_9BACT|nr:hypothetical protein [Aureibacter tunicatorum]MDR6240734.1 hypothetical protein [Aureibacter tunicatorum]BDD06933.1 hypothetical protein AUTU_44160 [Aureibacter tunicatorum]